MKSRLEAFDFLDPKKAPDRDLLTGLLDFLMHREVCAGYSYIFVPQLGENQGKPVRDSRFRKDVPADARSYALDEVKRHNITVPVNRIFQRDQVAGFIVSFWSIASVYDINIGAIALVSKSIIHKRDVAIILNAFEALLSLRKKAVALTYHGEFLQLDHSERGSLDRAVGDIIHKAVNPNETIILVADKSGTFKVAYSSRGTVFSISEGNDPASHCFRFRQTIVVNDTSEKHSIIQKFGSDFANREFMDHRKYMSCIFVPVCKDDSCYCMIACFFARKNAISHTEIDILQLISQILSDYYRLWTERTQLEEKISENNRITDLVRQSLLIADIMHDASEDLVTARGQIGLIRPRAEHEILALSSAKDSLKDLINASRHFREFFSRTAAETDGELLSPIATISSKNTFDSVDVYELVEELRTKYETAFSSHKIALKNNCSKSFVFNGIKYNVRRALDNALKNSIYHLQDKTHIRREINVTLQEVWANIKSGAEAEYVQIIVEDNGRGVEPENIRRIREPFVSLRGGMGLGLAIIQAACESHGGRLDISSEWGKYFRLAMTIRVQP